MAEEIRNKDEYAKIVDQLALNLMDVLNREQPPLSTVIDALCHVLAGAVGQLEPRELRDKVREFVTFSLLQIEEGGSGDLVDMTKQLRSAKH